MPEAVGRPENTKRVSTGKKLKAGMKMENTYLGTDTRQIKGIPIKAFAETVLSA